MAADPPRGDLNTESGPLHPYRLGDATRALDAEIEQCLHWRRRVHRRNATMTLAVATAALAAGVALTRAHWAGWIVVGVFALWLGPVTVISLVIARNDARFDERLRRDPGQIAWLHVETERSPRGMCACEVHLRDGTDSTFGVTADMAARLADRAPQWPFLISRTREAREAYLTDLQLRRMEDGLRHPRSSLASSLSPLLLPTIEERSCAALPADRVASLRAALTKLEVLLSAAVQVDASRARSRLKPELAALLHPDPPYSEEATQLAHGIGEAFS
jgi:hypothetical protein